MGKAGEQEVEKGAHLRRRQVPRRMIGVERETLLRPVGQYLHQLARCEQRPEAELDGLRDAEPGRAQVLVVDGGAVLV